MVDELPPLPLDSLVVLSLGIAPNREIVAALDAFVEVVRRRAFDRDVARLECQPELVHELEIRRVHRADDLAAELHRTAAVDTQLLDAAAHASTRLEDDHVRSAGRQVPCRREPGEPGAEDEDVGQPASSRRMLANRSVRAFSQPISRR